MLDDEDGAAESPAEPSPPPPHAARGSVIAAARATAVNFLLVVCFNCVSYVRVGMASDLVMGWSPDPAATLALLLGCH